MFITFEGLDFSGKSTQAKLLHEYFLVKKKKSILLREPGGTKISEKIREILLDREHLEMYPLTEFFMFSASRSQLVNEIIKPHLKKKFIVICDRYFDSSSAYQGYGGNLDMKKVDIVNSFAIGGLIPDLSFLINLSPSQAFSRAQNGDKLKDRIENKKLSYYKKVYEGFMEIADKNKKRFVILDGTKSIKDIHLKIKEIVNKKL
jgi:dTMP kinase